MSLPLIIQKSEKFMALKKAAAKNKISATQKYLDIAEIKEDSVVLKDGSLRAVLIASSINFSLKSEDEQRAVISAYVQFLNSLEFPLEIVIQSRKLDIDEYLERLKKIEKEQTNELLKMQTKEYREYIQELVEMADIMSKRFYLVIPYSPRSDKAKGFWVRLGEALSPTSVIKLADKKFRDYQSDLNKRVNFIVDGLASAGVEAIRLDTQGLIELYYNTYNPETYAQEKLVDLNKLNIES